MSFWCPLYAGDAFKYGARLNEFQMAQVRLLAVRSRGLSVGDGEGRNSVWLAQLGYAIVALDQSQAGMEKARRLALTCHIDTEQRTFPVTSNSLRARPIRA